MGAAIPSTGESDRIIPQPGDIVRVRTRTYLVESVEPGNDPIASAACLDDDAQGETLEVVWKPKSSTPRFSVKTFGKQLAAADSILSAASPLTSIHFDGIA